MKENKFKELGLNKNVLNSIETLGFDTPSSIQEQIIPLILEKKDVVGKAQTGTGKTLAYTASILTMLNDKNKELSTIVLVPTRELAIQVSNDFEKVNTNSKFTILPVYGGSDIEKQIRSIKKGVDIVVGTPGRVIDLIKRKYLSLNLIKYFILDEADEMLNMGFMEDIEYIFLQTKKEKQVMLFSATMPSSILKLAEKYMQKDYEFVEVEATSKTSENVYQSYYLINEKHRLEAMCRVLDVKNSKLGIIFCQTKKECDEILTALQARNYSVEAMHGDIPQAMRIQTLERFKNKSFNYLVATDVAARGIHVDHVDIVVNYRMPQDVESYIHRIGRTGRASNTGEAINLVTYKDLDFIKDIERIANCVINKKELPNYDEVFSAKYNMIIEKANSLTKNKENADYINYVRDMNKGDLINLSSSLLKILLDKEIGADFNKDIVVRERIDRDVSGNRTRVFLTIGKIDKIKKGSLLDFLKETTKVRKEKFNNIEILNKFTFIDVDTDVVDKVINTLYNKKLNDRIIRVEKAKKK